MLFIKEGKNYSVMRECLEPRIPEKFRALRFSKMVGDILGRDAYVSIVFVRQAKMQTINKKYRKINKPTDVLAFNLGEQGEILLSLNDSRKKAKIFGADFGNYLSYLLIHALLHLKGEAHSSKMNRLEKKYCEIFNIQYPFNK